MAQDGGPREYGARQEVMASIDGETEPRFVIADVSSDEAWLSVNLATASPLLEWR